MVGSGGVGLRYKLRKAAARRDATCKQVHKGAAALLAGPPHGEEGGDASKHVVAYECHGAAVYECSDDGLARSDERREKVALYPREVELAAIVILLCGVRVWAWGPRLTPG